MVGQTVERLDGLCTDCESKAFHILDNLIIFNDDDLQRNFMNWPSYTCVLDLYESVYQTQTPFTDATKNELESVKKSL